MSKKDPSANNTIWGEVRSVLATPNCKEGERWPLLVKVFQRYGSHLDDSTVKALMAYLKEALADDLCEVDVEWLKKTNGVKQFLPLANAFDLGYARTTLLDLAPFTGDLIDVKKVSVYGFRVIRSIPEYHLNVIKGRIAQLYVRGDVANLLQHVDLDNVDRLILSSYPPLTALLDILINKPSAKKIKILDLKEWVLYPEARDSLIFAISRGGPLSYLEGVCLNLDSKLSLDSRIAQVSSVPVEWVPFSTGEKGRW